MQMNCSAERSLRPQIVQYRGNIMSAVAAMARLKDVRIFLTRPFFIMCFFVSANLDMNGVGPVQKKKNDFLKSE